MISLSLELNDDSGTDLDQAPKTVYAKDELLLGVG